MNPAVAAREAISFAVKRALARAGHYRRRLAGDRFPGVAVLCYHSVRADGVPRGAIPFGGLHVSAAELDAHCRAVATCCDPISLAAWRAALDGGPPLPPRPVLFTFDDGYRAIARVARPILARHAIPAVIFVCGDPIASGRLHWYDAVARARGDAEAQRWKELPLAKWREAAADLPRDPAAADDPAAPLTVEDLAALAAAPGIEIGSHTARHPILARGTHGEQREEIAADLERLTGWCGARPRSFAYPSGAPGIDFSDDTVELVRAAGFDVAFTTAPRWARPDEPSLARSRFTVYAGTPAAELLHRLCYSWAR